MVRSLRRHWAKVQLECLGQAQLVVSVALLVAMMCRPDHAFLQPAVGAPLVVFTQLCQGSR